ncbi:MAG: LytTR family transcriptional regulator [Eubacterium sp.]|nr:LytTR family transcriptional regulator [Eubacterium sp.]
MSEMVIYDERLAEGRELAVQAKDINAYVSETRLNIYEYADGRKCIADISGDLQADMAVAAVEKNGDTSVPEEIRAAGADTSIMLVADGSVSPMKYLTPRIRACSLLIRPYDRALMRSTMKDFMRDHYSRTEETEEAALVIENFGEKMKVPVSQIYYIEARGKKVFIRLKKVEYSEYATFESLMQQLGEQFVRCHRSFAFNRIYFESAKISENTVNLAHGLSVPLSRSYKSMIRGFINGGR